MCQITPSEVAVTVNEDKTHEVQFVLMNDRRLDKARTLQFQHKCNGIAHEITEIPVSHQWHALVRYSMSGDLLEILYEDTTGWELSEKGKIVSTLKTSSSF